MTTAVRDDVHFADFGKEMWDFLTGRHASISYRFRDMEVQVPRSTGTDSPRAIWVLNGALEITTSDGDDAARR
ncbi:hypothetical protein Cme02nite_49070 [Catellatospora methionotrophica]|uniref:Uncharacterized protein n=1 Tax=Catellatospora methionotrophica TaxID=121620 RepID=A0A8J3LPL8_9ACTN|nr:hypothetical protein [Catellatospora methionotrophica]GIG16575.1 hypothetical protein Cme02nite_49070 [Catellatospora methionotrophica]